MNLQASLDTCLKSLKLTTILSEYQRIAKYSLEEKDSYEGYLLKLTKREEEARFNKKIKNLLKQAHFPKIKTIDEYNFNRSSISKESILQLCHGNFLTESENIIFFGSPGSGKTHLTIGIGRELCLKGFKVIFFTGCSLVQELVKEKNNLNLTAYFKRLMNYDLVIIDELGYIPFDKTEGDLLFQFISDRYECKSIMITTNLAFSEWDSIFYNKAVASASIDRLLHYSQIFKFEKELSYRSEIAKKRLQDNKIQ